MKHSISLLLLIAALLLTACSASQPQETTPDTIPESTANEHINIIPYRTFQSKYKFEYDEFVENTELPKNFVTYEDLQGFGDFDMCVINFDDYSDYYYVIKDANGIYFVIYIKPGFRPEMSTRQQIFSLQGMTSMLQLATPVGETAEYVRGELTYIYHMSGTLSGIRWIHNDIHFELYGFETDYKTETETLFNKLTSISETEALAAFNELKQSLPTE